MQIFLHGQNVYMQPCTCKWEHANAPYRQVKAAIVVLEVEGFIGAQKENIFIDTLDESSVSFQVQNNLAGPL